MFRFVCLRRKKPPAENIIPPTNEPIIELAKILLDFAVVAIAIAEVVIVVVVVAIVVDVIFWGQFSLISLFFVGSPP